jgi:transcriptional regulator with XRE-family HTH domain
MNRKLDILFRFGKRVRELRKAQGFSQEAFAAQCGLDRTYIGGIERGERNVALRNIEVIAKALDVTISELMQGLESEGVNG